MSMRARNGAIVMERLEERSMLSGLPWNEPATPVTGSEGTSSVAADFDLDGKIDLAVASGNELRFLKGNGDGTFAAPVGITLNTRVGNLAAGRMDGDARPDLADAINMPNGKTLVRMFCFDQQTGGFTTSARLVVQDAWSGSAFNRNTPPAVRTGNTKGGWRDEILVQPVYNEAIEVRVINKTRLAAGERLGTDFALGAARIADFNADGRDELWYIKSNGVYRREFVFAGSAAQQVYTARSIADFALADFDSDGNLDIFVQQRSNFVDQPEPLALLLGFGDGRLASKRSWDWPAGLENAQGLTIEAVGDVNGDGRLDVILHEYWALGTRIGQIENSAMVLLIDDGAGGWTGSRELSVSVGTYTREIPSRGRFMLADFTGSGVDLVERPSVTGGLKLHTNTADPIEARVLGGSFIVSSMFVSQVTGFYARITANSIGADFGGSIRHVEVVHDANNNGVIDAGEEVVGSADSRAVSENVFRVAAILPDGATDQPEFRLLARAVGIDGSVSAAVDLGSVTWIA